MGFYDGKGIPLKGGGRLKKGENKKGTFEIDLKKIEKEDGDFLSLLKKKGIKLKSIKIQN